MSDEEMAWWEARALAQTARVVEPPENAKDLERLDQMTASRLADAFLDLIERVRVAERAAKAQR